MSPNSQVLVRELRAVDGLSTRAITASKVTALEHELGDDTMEAGALVAETWGSLCELEEILRGLGDNIVEEVKVDTTGVLAVDGDVELND